MFIHRIICLSKGRPDRKLAKTLTQASEQNAEFRERFQVLVEPRELDAYQLEFPNLQFTLLPQNFGGLPYARQHALHNFKNFGMPFWMLDDDISSFGLVQDQRVCRVPMQEAFQAAESVLHKTRETLKAGGRELGQAALEYQQFAWASKTQIAWRGYCDVAVWINAPALLKGTGYRNEVLLKEDRDFTLQILASGLETARISKVCFGAPKNGSNAGGLAEEYAMSGREAKAVESMVELWPGLVTRQLKKTGRIDCKIDWKRAFGYYARLPS